MLQNEYPRNNNSSLYNEDDGLADLFATNNEWSMSDGTAETEPSDRPRIPVLGVHDIMQPLPEVQYIVEGIISEGSVTLLVGEPGSKKTYTMLALWAAVASGEDWVNHPTKKSTALFVDLESGRYRIIRRMQNVLAGYNLTDNPPEGLKLVTGQPVDIRTEAGKKYLNDLIAQEKPGLVIIDALADLIPGADENSVKDTQPPFMTLREVAEKNNTAMIIIHHTNKSGGYRGSSALKGSPDNLIVVESAPDSNIVTFRSEKMRDSEPIRFSASAIFESDSFFLDGADPSDSESSSRRGVVLSLFHENGDMTVDQANLLLENSGMTKESLRNIIKDLTKEEKLFRKNPGGRGSKAIYGVYGF